MSEAAYKPTQRVEKGSPLRVTSYDRAASGVLAGLILVGSTVSLMLLVWLSNRMTHVQVSVPVVMEDIMGSGEEGPAGGGQELQAPTQGDLSDEVVVNSQPELSNALSLVATTIEQSPDVSRPIGPYSDTGEGGGRGGGKGTGIGPGRGGRLRHWEFRFPPKNTLVMYARQLDFFNIELGVLRPGNRVEYVFHFSKTDPDRRSGPADKETRYYLTWRKGDLEQADRDLLARAGVHVQSSDLILKFLPPPVEQNLAALERARAGARLKDVRRTDFGVKAEGNGYVFFVADQKYK
jgi:hypothetical protein